MGAFTTVPQQQGSPAPAGAPQGAPPSEGAPTAAPQDGGQQGNPLQEALGQVVVALQKIGQMNEIVSPDINEAIAAIRKAFLKTIQTPNQNQPQQAPTPSAF